MKWIIAFTISLLFTFSSFSQKNDYRVIRDTITKLSCKQFDSITIMFTNLELRNIDTNVIDKNIDLYYRDLGWSFYRYYLYTKDTNLVRNSIECYKKANSHKANDPTTYWELAHLHYILEDCMLGNFYLAEFKRVTEKQYWREDQIKLMTKRCGY